MKTAATSSQKESHVSTTTHFPKAVGCPSTSDFWICLSFSSFNEMESSSQMEGWSGRHYVRSDAHVGRRDHSDQQVEQEDLSEYDVYLYTVRHDCTECSQLIQLIMRSESNTD